MQVLQRMPAVKLDLDYRTFHAIISFLTLYRACVYGAIPPMCYHISSNFFKASLDIASAEE